MNYYFSRLQITRNDISGLIFRFSCFKQVGPNYTSAYSMLIHSTCTAECPASCSNDWAYFERIPHPGNPNFEKGNFAIDESINVSCGKDSIIMY